MSRSLFLLSATGFFAAVVAAQAELTLNRVGGSTGIGNYGTLAATSAFAFDVIPAAPHSITNVNNGTFGNASSWIGNSNNSFVGLNFGTKLLPLGSVAWGRSNVTAGDPCGGGVCVDRTAGTYTLAYTQVTNPGAGLAFTGNAATGWADLGSVNYLFQGAVGSPISMSSRHLWSFPTVNATGIRLTAPGNSFADGAAIDELEAYSARALPFSLVTTGGAMDVSTNIALTSTAFARDLINNGGFPAHDSIGNINDGLYGNDASWIGNSESSFIGLDFNGSQTVNRFAFSRDNLAGGLVDRSGGTYMLQYTTSPAPNASTPDSSWLTIGSIYYDHDGADSADRHEYSFAPVTATGLRLFAAGDGIGSGRAIDEFEVYAVIPEPGVMALGLLAACAGLRRRQR